MAKMIESPLDCYSQRGISGWCRRDPLIRCATTEFPDNCPLHDAPDPEDIKAVCDFLINNDALGNIRVPDYISKNAIEAARRILAGETPKKKHGCFVDGPDDIIPDCVVDTLDFEDCIYAKDGMKKEQCKYWREMAGEDGE